MAKKKRRLNKLGHVFVCEWLGKDWFRDDQGKITDEAGDYAGDKLDKIINEQYPVVAPVEVNAVGQPKVKRRRPAKVSTDTAEPKPEAEEPEDKPSRTKRILKYLYPEIYEGAEKLREAWTGKSRDKDRQKELAGSKGGRFFDLMYPGVRNKAKELKRVWTGEEEPKEATEKKRVDEARRETDKRLQFNKIEDGIGSNAEYMRKLLAVNQRSATLLSQIAEDISKLSRDSDSDKTPSLDKDKNKFKGPGAFSRTMSALTGIPNLTQQEVEERLNPPTVPKEEQSFWDRPMTDVISEWWNGNKKKDQPAAKEADKPAQPPASKMTDEEEAKLREDAIKKRGQRLGGGRQANTVVPEVAQQAAPQKDIAASKETAAIAEAKQKQVKAEDVLNFEAGEINFKSDRLTFEVQTLTVEKTGAPAVAGPEAAAEGSGAAGGAAGGQSGAGGGGGGTGATGSAEGGVTPQAPGAGPATPQQEGAAKVTTPPTGEGGATPQQGAGAEIKAGKFSEQAPAVMDNLMKDFGLTKEQAAGIVGNLGHESAGLQAGIQEKGVTRGRGGLGWAQWTGPRRREFEAYLKETGQEATDPKANYGFLKRELETTHKSSLEAIKKETTAEGATVAFEKSYERAGVKHYASRQAYTQQALKASYQAEVARKEQEKKQAEQAEKQPQAVPEKRPEMTAEDKIALEGGELPDATKLPGGDEGLNDREVRAANMMNASNVMEKEAKAEDAAKLDASEIAGYETSFDVGTGPQTQQQVAQAIPEPPRRPADLTAPQQASQQQSQPSPKAQSEAPKEARQRSMESHSPMPGGNGAQFLETVFRIMPYLLQQKKHAPKAGGRWHY